MINRSIKYIQLPIFSGDDLSVVQTAALAITVWKLFTYLLGSLSVSRRALIFKGAYK